MKPISPAEESILADLVSLWQRRCGEGQAVRPADLCRDRPELLPELERRIAALKRLDGLADVVGETISVASTDASTPSVPVPPVAAGRPEIPGFEILSVLGRGGMGIVYLARDRQLKRQVALKMVLAGVSSSEGSLGRFHSEAEAVARLQHPHVVQVFSWGEHDGSPYLVMEYEPGGGLDRRIAGQPQPPADAARLVMLLARAVHAAHKAGVVHRDLKPANILLAAAADEPALNTVYGWPKISDFGLARLSGGGGMQTASHDVLGTPCYMAPEQAAGKAREVGPAADIYALGAILYDLLTGRPPFKGESLLETLDMVRSLPPRPPHELCAGMPPGLEAICLRCLAKSPEDRPATAADLAEDLRRFLEGHSAALLPSPPVDTPRGTETTSISPGSSAATLPKLLSTDDERNQRSGRKRAAIGLRIGRWSCTFTLALGIAAIVLTGLPFWWLVETMPREQQESAPVVAQKLEILRLDVQHFPTVSGRTDLARVGLLGKDSFNTLVDDSVKINARLSRPAYAFLIAFRPDGTPDVCFPEKDDVPPPLTDQPRYPSDSVGYNYGLQEGTGLQVFALVVSSQPLPSFKEWWAQYPGCPWQKHEAPPGVVWRSDGLDDIKALTEDNPNGQRAKKRKVSGKTAVAQLAQWLRKAPQVEAVEVLGFAVMPREKR